MSTLQVLLHELIDYAGLFPPAELAMRPAVENYQRYLAGPDRWMLGRFIVPAARLGEFESILSTIKNNEQHPWLLSALIAPASHAPQFAADLHAVAEFNRRQTLAFVDTLEGKASSPREVSDAVEQIPSQQALFLEIPLDERLERQLDALQSSQATRSVLAKVRTGGVVAEAIPRVEQVAAFLAGCARRNLGFKATAGLHHPIRASYRLTYREHSPCAVMYGFLNVFVAACAAYDAPGDVRRVGSVLTETDISQFAFSPATIQWRDASWDRELVQKVRKKGVAFGSCSFVEPVDDLRKAGLLA
jgi:hypothetical protein